MRFFKAVDTKKDSLDTAGKRELIDLQGLNNETDKALPIFPYGFKSRIPSNAGSVFCVENNGVTSTSIALGGDFIAPELKDDEMLMLYNQNTAILTVKNDGSIVINGKDVTVNASGKAVVNSSNVELGGEGGGKVLTENSKFVFPAGQFGVNGGPSSPPTPNSQVNIVVSNPSTTTKAK